MCAKELEKYLKTAAELESSVHRQTSALERAQYMLERFAPNRIVEKESVPAKPEMPDIPVPTKPVLLPEIETPQMKKKNKNARKEGTKYRLLTIGTVLLGIFLTIRLESIILCIIFGILAFFMLGSSFSSFDKIENVNNNKQRNEQAIQAYKLQQDEYNQEYAKCKKEYEKQCRIYNEVLRSREAEYQRKMTSYMKKYVQAESHVKTLENSLSHTQNTLLQLYSHDIIYPKYRNLVAMCTIYEYFASGRCSELTGPHGAYNLYESELRQNIIIGKIDLVIKKLDKISSNQYYLYQELCHTNEIVREISKDLNKLLNVTMSIEQKSHISALATQSIAKNTEALKYIALIQ